MRTPGKPVLAAFAAGVVAAALLFALPLISLRGEVQRFDEEQRALAADANATAAEHLRSAATALDGWAGAPPGAIDRAREEVRAAATALELAAHARGDDGLAVAAANARGALDRAADAAACGVLEPRSPAGSALADLARALDAAGTSRSDGTLPGPGPLPQAAGALEQRVRETLAASARATNVTLHGDAVRAEVHLAGPLPSEACRGSLVAEACLVEGGARTCERTSFDEVPGAWTTPRSAAVPVPGNATGEATVEVRLDGELAAVEANGTAGASVPAWPLTVEPLDRGWDSDVTEARTAAVTDEAAFEELWSDHANGTRPSVDLDASVVVAAFAGQRPTGCHGVHLEDVTVAPNGIVRVVAEHLESAPVRCTDEPSTPYAIATLPDPGAPVTVTAERR